MEAQDLRSMLARVGVVRHACDLDLLLFFFRHPCVLLTVEQLIPHLGCDRERVAKSLDGLVEAGLVTSAQRPSQGARMYVLAPEALPGGLLSSFLSIAATRQGRLEAMRLLGSSPALRAGRRGSLSKVA
jgi:hypothetical protein